jgi:23S rRNA pseudouridine2605 synthase
MLAAVGLSVLDLQRVRFGTVRLGRLRAGDARRLRPSEVAELRRLVGLEA